MLAWVMNLGFAATGAEGSAEGPGAVTRESGTPLLLGTGCWIMPLLAAVLMGVR